MAHPRIIRQQMLDWIKNSLSLRRALPTDVQIVDRFNLPGVESARSLLADLADAGEITIKGHGWHRTITLGRKPKAFEAAPRPTPAVVARVGGKRADDEKVQIDTATARIRAILERGKSAVAVPTPAVSAELPVEAETEAVEIPASVPEIAEPVEIEAIAPDIKATIDVKQLPSASDLERFATAPARLSRQEGAIATRDVRRQLNIHFPQDQFEKLSALADVAGETPGAFARGALISCIDRKPRVPAAVTAAALREKTPVIDFADRMMVLGLAAYAHERAGSAA